MKYYNTLEEYRSKSGRPGGRLVGEENGAVRGCCVGLSHGMSRVHKEVGDIHEDQEGFFVWKGHGEALIGDEVIEMKPGVSIMVPAGVPHSMKVLDDAEYYETIWFHAAISPDSVPEKTTSYASSIMEKTGKEMASCDLLGAENGCVDGCRAGVTCYTDLTYTHTGIHEDQEGFFVLEGSGIAKIGDTEFPVSAGTAFICPANTWHSIRRDESCAHVAVFWFHSAV